MVKRHLERIATFIGSTISRDFGINSDDSKHASSSSSESEHLSKDLLESRDFADEGLYNVFIIPFKFEKLICIQGLMHLCALIYNLVVLPIRVTWSLLCLLIFTTREGAVALTIR